MYVRTRVGALQFMLILQCNIICHNFPLHARVMFRVKCNILCIHAYMTPLVCCLLFTYILGKLIDPVSRFECVSGLRVYPVEIRSVNNLSSSEDCSTDYCQPV